MEMNKVFQANLTHTYHLLEYYVSLTFLNSCVRQWLCFVQNMMNKMRKNSAKFFSSPRKLPKKKKVGKVKVVHSSLIVYGG